MPKMSEEILAGTAPLSWASVRGGKWHRTTVPALNFRDDATALCGVVFEPMNITHDAAPPTNERHMCSRCVAQHKKAATAYLESVETKPSTDIIA